MRKNGVGVIVGENGVVARRMGVLSEWESRKNCYQRCYHDLCSKNYFFIDWKSNEGKCVFMNTYLEAEWRIALVDEKVVEDTEAAEAFLDWYHGWQVWYGPCAVWTNVVGSSAGEA